MAKNFALEISNVYANYGFAPVVRDVSFYVDSGETFGLIGLNGAGKTTLLKTILGLKQQTAGTINLFSHPRGSVQAKKEIGFLPERFDPPWFLNAYEFIDFTLSLYGQRVARKQIDDMAQRVGLDVSFLPKRAQAYSKGMRQKLGLMTVFLTGCSVLILDEPMSGLDPLARSQVKNLMIEAKQKGRAVFLSSHILSDMEELCDRVAVLHAGTIRFIGKPSVLLADSGQTTLEKAFLGLINEGTVRAA